MLLIDVFNETFSAPSILQYEYLGFFFTEGLTWVELNKVRGFIDKTGKEVIPIKYDAADNFSEGLARVQLNGKWGYIDKNGKEVLPIKYYKTPRVGVQDQYGIITF